MQLHEKEIEFIKGVGNCDLSDDEDAEDKGTAKVKEDKGAAKVKEDKGATKAKEEKGAEEVKEDLSSAPELANDQLDSPAKSPKSRTPAKRKLPSAAAARPSKQAKKPAKKKWQRASDQTRSGFVF